MSAATMPGCPRLLAVSVLALSLAGAAYAAEPDVVVTSAKPAESQLRPKPAPKAAAAKPAPAAPAAKAEPAQAEAEAEAPVANGYVCVTNSCAKVAMLPMISEADQIAAAEEAAQMALVRDVATQIASRVLGLSFAAGADDEADVALAPVADGDEGEGE